MIASLPMYDWPELRAATDAFWAALSRHIESLPPIDHRQNYTETWRNPGLLFSQTCGYPFTHEFHGKLTYVATPHYSADGCEGASYCSIVLARERAPLESFRGRTAAVNTPDSMSGMLALKLVFAPLADRGRFFGNVMESGGHVRSMLAVRDGLADVCAIDAVCVGLARRYRPDCLEGLVEIARSPTVPGLPFVTIAGDAEVIRRGLADCFANPETAAAREALLLTGLSVLDPQAYGRILELERTMEQHGGLELL
jgi:ABC-type phosphate/phosphonate transport system substrate-binding protein